MDLKTLDNDLEIILNRPNELISKSEAEDLKLLGKQAFEQNNLGNSLEFNIRAAKVYETLFKKADYGQICFIYLFEIAKCYDHAGRCAAFLAADPVNDMYYRRRFTKYSMKFKELAGNFYVKASIKEKDTRHKKLLYLLAAQCYDRAGKSASLFFQDHRNGVRLKRQSYIFYKRVGKYGEAIWRLIRAVDDLCYAVKDLEHIDDNYKKGIQKLSDKIRLLMEEHGLPRGFNLEKFEGRVQGALLR